jgi:hypothetical protein
MLDIGQVRDRSLEDGQGRVIPRWVQQGQAQWEDLTPARGLIGRVAIYDPQRLCCINREAAVLVFLIYEEKENQAHVPPPQLETV